MSLTRTVVGVLTYEHNPHSIKRGQGKSVKYLILRRIDSIPCPPFLLKKGLKPDKIRLLKLRP
jgi:hypothetical protein